MNPLLLLAAVHALDCPTQTKVLTAAAGAIEAQYVDVEQGRRLGAEVRRWAKEDRYAAHCDDQDAFLAAVNRDLDAYDPHFLLEPSDRADKDDWLTAWRAETRTANAGVREVRVLDGNVGYLRLSSFYPWAAAQTKLAQAFGLLADVDGLILDLRQNGGGEAEGAEQIVAALLGDGHAAVQDIERRGRPTPDALPTVELPRIGAGRPVAILMDRRSASAAEYVAYSLQAAGRAKIVGTRSGGVAHMLGDPVPIAEGFALFVPTARPVNRTTGGNWEGRGVTPDIPGGDDPLYRARAWIGEAMAARP